MNPPPPNPTAPVLSLDDLAARWKITAGELKRRAERLGLPAINVGTDRAPDYRFPLAMVERWEQLNCVTLGRPPDPGQGGAKPVRPRAPRGADGFDPYAVGNDWYKKTPG